MAIPHNHMVVKMPSGQPNGEARGGRSPAGPARPYASKIRASRILARRFSASGFQAFRPAARLWALIAVLALSVAFGGCIFKNEVPRDEFDHLTGRVTKLEDTVYRGPAAGQPGQAAGQFGQQPQPGQPGQPVSYGAGGQVPPLPPAGNYGPLPQGALASYTSGRASAGDRSRYQQAHALLKQRRYPQAATVFAQMLTDNPRGPLAPNARYWLGECRYAAGDFNGALVEFERGLADYPRSNKAPDCLLKISYCLSRLGDAPGAMRSLNRLLEQYPDSPSAQLVRGGRTRFAAD